MTSLWQEGQLLQEDSVRQMVSWVPCGGSDLTLLRHNLRAICSRPVRLKGASCPPSVQHQPPSEQEGTRAAEGAELDGQDGLRGKPRSGSPGSHVIL